jgi:outer membrane murein-binding lipoprotein Lpp
MAEPPTSVLLAHQPADAGPAGVLEDLLVGRQIAARAVPRPALADELPGAGFVAFLVGEAPPHWTGADVRRVVAADRPTFAVLLPAAGTPFDLTRLASPLRTRTWVDLRAGIDETTVEQVAAVVDGREPVGVALSPSVMRAWARARPETAVDLATSLLEEHPSYAGHRAGVVRLGPSRDDAPRQPGADWVRSIALLLAPGVQELHTRLALLVLGLLDEHVGVRLSESGVFSALAGELDEPLTSVLSADALLLERALHPLPRAGFVPDDPSGPDVLDIGDEVLALGDLIASSDVVPPVAIGLFGEWGSGKSFFMRALRRQVDELAEEARRTAEADGAPVHLSRIVQIDFNAWQYLDANLWAGLAAHIFTKLTEALGAQRLPEVYRTLEAVRQPLEEATERKAAAERDLAAAHAALGRLRTEHEQTAASLTQVRRDDLVAIASAVTTDLDQEVRALERHAHLPENSLDVRDAVDNARRLRGAGIDVRALWWLTRSSLVHHRGRVLAASLAVPLALWASLALLDRSDLAAAAAVVGALVPSLVTAGRIALALGGSQSALRRTIDEIGDRPSEAERTLQATIERLDRELAAARHQEKAATVELAAAEAELELIDQGRSLPRFFKERIVGGVAGRDYRQHLGLVNVIQRDFEQLSRCLGPRDGTNGDAPGEPRVDRIVLYIDDLDRCGAKQVVEVLQALNLLLAFRLFVVVVGVDPRWLIQSLRLHHRALAGEGGDAANGSTAEAGPHAYLEKIIQIPFRLQPMQQPAYTRLVASLLPVEDGDPAPPPRPRDGTSGDASGGRAGDADDASSHAADSDRTADDAAAPRTRRLPPALRFTTRERTFIGQLAPLVATPRATKRLANTYRLLRASVRSSELRAFLGTSEGNGEFRPALTLLTILIRFPEFETTLERTLASASVTDWQSLRTGLADEVEGLPGAPELVRALDQIAGHIAADTPAETFARWLPRVVRYSFHAPEPPRPAHMTEPDPAVAVS